jgi:M6 family metalloprotease-like protein
MSRPFVGKEFTFTNPDGSEIHVRGWGDQYYAVFETLDGFTVVKDPESGFYQYARLSDDKNDLLPTGGRVGSVDPRSLGLPQHIRIRREVAKKKAVTARGLQGPQRRWEIRRQQKKTPVRAAPEAGRPAIAPPSDVTIGAYVGLCLLIEFPDVPATISQQEVNDFCNQQGYSGFGNNGSVRDYFHDVSRGRVNYTNVVTAYYTAANNRAHYTDPAIAYGTRARELIVEALDHLVSQGFDFSQLSSDSDGFVYALNVYYAGPRVNNWAEGLWPHAWALASPYEVSGKKLNDYQITDMANELTLGTFCHENCHMLCDFPDLYDYGYESRGIGNFCLMCFGGDERNPVEVCAYLKNEAGWADSVTPIISGMHASVSDVDNDFYTYAKSQTEYFIIENRQQQGRDASLPDAGLVIWHIDELGSNNYEQMTPSQHYECSLEQADNRFDLEHGANEGDNEDLFGSPYHTQFADTTDPNSRWWDGSNSGLSINQISAPGPTVTFETPGEPSQIEAQILGLLLLDKPSNVTAPASLLLG